MAEDDKAELFARVAAFEWDEDKRERNLRDHKVDFEDARQIVDGPTFVRRSDREGEIRYMVFGFVNGGETGRRLYLPRRKLPPDLGAQSEA